MPTLARIGEKELLQRFQKYLGKSQNIMRVFSEDCAVVDSGKSGKYLLYTVDSFVEGVHFSFEYMPPYYAGRKAFKVNLSDISAMGGTPLYYMVSLGAPANTSVTIIDEIYHGMTDVAGECQAKLIGGNVCSSNKLFLDIFLVGEVRKDEVLFRNRARSGDRIFVTGPLGASAEGLKLLKNGFRLSRSRSYVQRAILAHLDPPDLNNVSRKFAQWKMLHSMIDLSDGLGSDLAEICRESGVGARIELEKIPVDPCVTYWEKKQGLKPLDLALSGGEDYHLLFTLPLKKRKGFLDRCRRNRIQVFEIGEITDEPGQIWGTDRNGIKHGITGGYQHFRKQKR